MVSDAVEKKLLFPLLVIVICFSCFLLDRTGVAAFNMEETNWFNYANLTYILVVLTGLGAFAAGSISLIYISVMAEKERRERDS